MTIPLDDWLGVMDREYAGSFIHAGGAAVRIAIAEPDLLDRAAAGLRAQAIRSGLHTISVSLAETRLHMLQNLFFAVAAALPWEDMLQARAEALVAEAGHRWPRPGQRVTLAELAEHNAIAPHLLRRDLSQAMTATIWHDAAMAQDFRSAMMALLETRFAGEEDGLGEAIMDWLRGGLRSVALVKPAQIGARIGRNNARAMLMSLCHWVRACNGTGILLLLDISRLHQPRGGDGLQYTAAAVMDCYEVLRQMIDDAEHFPGLLLVALAGPAAVEPDAPRGIGKYTALQMRVVDDVRPQGRDNRLAPLVRLAA